ncbi:MAG: hypothetical protein ABI237_07195 [Ginsengibacter sp.]
MENNQIQNQLVVDPFIIEPNANEGNEGYFNLIVDKIPYRVEFDPFFFDDQVRYYVSINAGPKDVFVWNTGVQQFKAINDKSVTLPVVLERAISAQLQNHEAWNNFYFCLP